MNDFSFVKKIGGVKIDPRRVTGYSAIQQRDILDAMFGYRHSDGGLVLPGGGRLDIARRKDGESKYSNGRVEREGIERFALCVPSVGRRPLLENLGEDGAWEGEMYGGFLATATKMILILGKKALGESVGGQKESFGPISGETKERAGFLASCIIESGLEDPDAAFQEDVLEIIDRGIAELLGERLAEVEAFRREFPSYPAGPSYEEFAIGIVGRISEVARH